MEDIQMENILDLGDSDINLCNIHESFDSLTFFPPASPFPAVSVIIPLYNAEKYIGECLDSLFVQTFQDFELIIVDDCSTDSSCKIVESYMPRFNGRLKLYHTEKNFGSGAIARNVGLSHAVGEYVFNMDNDDMITKTALEEMYTFAKEYDADVVYCEKYYEANDRGKNIRIKVWQTGDLVDKPTLETEDLRKRVQSIIDDRYWVVPWSKMVRRKFVVDNEIFFPPLNISDDNIWNQGLVFYSKTFLRVPNTVYIYRLTPSSIMRVKKSPEVLLKFWLRPVLLGLKALDNLMSKHEFFKTNPDCRYAILKKFVNVRFKGISGSISRLSEDVVYKILQDEFGKNFGEYDVLISALCTNICDQNNTLRENTKKIQTADDTAQKDKELIAAQAEEIKQLKAKMKSMPYLSASHLTCPEISVIIPMYNVEKYVGDCLDSLLAQTFQDFEVIVVDDCSTDGSVSIVESYATRFKGRLQIFKLKEKSVGGGGSLPRNKGIELSTGKYVFCLDADDAITATAFDELHKIAEEFEADVVHCEKFYRVPDKIWNNKKERRKLKPDNHFTPGRLNVTSPTLLSDSIAKRVEMFSEKKLIWNFWAQLIRRDFIIENEIVLPDAAAQDMLFTMCSLCCAKRYVVVPNVVNFYRIRDDSVTTEKIDHVTKLCKWLKVMRVDIEYLNNFFAGRKELSNLTDLKYMLFDVFMKQMLEGVNAAYRNMSPFELDEILQKEFAVGDNVAFTAVVFSMMNMYRIKLARSK